MTITNIALDDSGDIAINANNTGFNWIADLDAIAQACATRLRLLRGEWLLDTTAGLDFSRVIGPGVTDRGIESEVRRVLSEVVGVVSVIAVDVARTDRSVVVEFTAQGQLGRLITGSIEV